MREGSGQGCVNRYVAGRPVNGQRQTRYGRCSDECLEVNGHSGVDVVTDAGDHSWDDQKNQGNGKF